MERIIKYILSLAGLILLAMNCQKETSSPSDTFGYAMQQLAPIADLQILQNNDAMIAVSGSYQGRIFTSSARGKSGKSYGWFNQDLIDKNLHETEMAHLGGESRLWFAPEWGPFSLYFESGKPQNNANLRRPKDLQTKKFSKIASTAHSLTYGGEMQLVNDHDYVFDIAVVRKIALLSKNEIEHNLQITLPNDVAVVGFSAENIVENISDQPLKKETGLIGIWELGCMLTTPDNVVILPLSQPTDSITEYFAATTNRIQIKNQVAYYKADAQGLSKIGIAPKYCKNVMGSYSPSQKLLNIVTFTFDKAGEFVNSQPENTAPYQGDVINIFNGVVNEALELPFYEFESISSSKEMLPQEKMMHRQTTYHFEGEVEVLAKIARVVLGVNLEEIPRF
ncbi:MAG: DUF6786 family protein [Bacteroidota bacterium]